MNKSIDDSEKQKTMKESLSDLEKRLDDLEKQNTTLVENNISLERALSFTIAHRDTLQKQMMNLLLSRKVK